MVDYHDLLYALSRTAIVLTHASFIMCACLHRGLGIGLDLFVSVFTYFFLIRASLWLSFVCYSWLL